MSKCLRVKGLFWFFVFILWGLPALAQEVPHIVSTSPTKNQLNVAASTNISVTFDVEMNASTINNSTFIVNARSTGRHLGTITYNSATKTATLDPTQDFVTGEVVTVLLTTGIQSSGGTPLEKSYTWSFTVLANCCGGTFSPHKEYPAGNFPWSIFAADLDGDGDIDLATANLFGNTVSVLLNNGNANFSSSTDYAVGDMPYSVFVADLNGDGYMDLATANRYGYSVSVLLNNGDATFSPHTDYPVDQEPNSVFAADLDGDGDMDLATANEGSEGHTVSILLNNGDATFSPHTEYPLGDYPRSIFSADLDGDGDMDLATANYYGTVSVLLNNGDATFSPRTDYPVVYGANSIFAADLDGDGDMDLATANWEVSTVSVLLNNGDATFSPHTEYPVGNRPWSIFAADLDGDGDIDLATANTSGNNPVSVLLNNGDATFSPRIEYPVGGGKSVFAADLDGDGNLDLATANGSSNTVIVLINSICGNCNDDRHITVSDVVYLINYLFKGGPIPVPKVCLGDANGDGKVTVSDVVYLINYLFKGGPAPGVCCQ